MIPVVAMASQHPKVRDNRRINTDDNTSSMKIIPNYTGEEFPAFLAKFENMHISSRHLQSAPKCRSRKSQKIATRQIVEDYKEAASKKYWKHNKFQGRRANTKELKKQKFRRKNALSLNQQQQFCSYCKKTRRGLCMMKHCIKCRKHEDKRVRLLDEIEHPPIPTSMYARIPGFEFGYCENCSVPYSATSGCIKQACLDYNCSLVVKNDLLVFYKEAAKIALARQRFSSCARMTAARSIIKFIVRERVVDDYYFDLDVHGEEESFLVCRHCKGRKDPHVNNCGKEECKEKERLRKERKNKNKKQKVFREELSEQQKQLLKEYAEPRRLDLNDSLDDSSSSSSEPLRKAAEEAPSLSAESTFGIAELANQVLDRDDPANDKWISHVENIAILAYHISRADCFLDFFTAICGYIKMTTTQSIARSVIDCITDLSSFPCEVEPQSLETTKTFIKNFPSNWKLMKDHAMYPHFAYLISAAMSAGVCSAKEIEWSPLGLKLISIKAAEKQLEAFDLIDALVQVFTWTATVGYRVFEEKSLMPLLYTDDKMRRLNRDSDWCMVNGEHVINGNNQEIDLQEFEYKLRNTLQLISEMKAAKPDAPTAIWLQSRYAVLTNLLYEVHARYKNAALRFMPFGVTLTGPTGVSKSNLSKIVMKIGIEAMGYEYEPNRVLTKDEFDQYDSTWTTDIMGVFMDDFGNGRPEFSVEAPTSKIIKFFNNMAAQAVKAELNQKGIVFIDFKVGVISSNFKDLNVSAYTDVPEACLRRFVHTRVQVKPHLRVPGGVSLDKENAEIFQQKPDYDVWELDLEEVFVYKFDDQKEAYMFRPLDIRMPEGDRIVTKKMDLRTYQRVIVELARRHQKHQLNQVKGSEEFDNTPLCKQCCLTESCCRCKTEPNSYELVPGPLREALGLAETVFRESLFKGVQQYFLGFLNPFAYAASWFKYTPIRQLATSHLASEVTRDLHDWLSPMILGALPPEFYQNWLVQRYINHYAHLVTFQSMRYYRYTGTFLFLASGFSYLYGFHKSHVAGTVALLAGGSACWTMSLFAYMAYRRRRHKITKIYSQRADAVTVYAEESRRSRAMKAAMSGISVACLVILLKCWNEYRKRPSKALTEYSRDELIRALEAKNDDVQPEALNLDGSPGWFGFMMSSVGAKISGTPSSTKATSEQLKKTFEKNNLFWAEYVREDGTRTQCNIFFPRKSVAWFPKHTFYPHSKMDGLRTPTLTVTVYRHSKAGGVFTFKVDDSSCVFSQQHDLCVAYVPNCPDLKTKVKWLPISQPLGTSLCQLLVRTKEDFESERVTVAHREVGHKYMKFYGGDYDTSLARTGACMGILIAEQKNPVVVGFHIGGNGEQGFGVMQTITVSEAEGLISRLGDKPGILLSAEAGSIPNTQFGRTVLKTSDIHPHCMASKLKENDFVEVIGSTSLRSRMVSKVQPSVLSEHVEAVIGIPNKWGPPKVERNWEAFNATLEHVINPSDMFVPAKLERARQDWLKPLIPLLQEYIRNEKFAPLTFQESICGVPGKRFLEPLKMSTSMGFPVFGPKKSYFEEIWEGGVLVARIPNRKILDEYDRMEHCLQKGERAYPVCSATLKDEPTKLDSTKVRVFQNAAVAMSLHLRKYFLPVIRFLCKHPLESESAVGINAFSQEWETVMKHASKYAPDGKMLGLDYSKYDVRMNSQITRAVLTSYVELARIGGYSKRDLHIMEMLIADVVHPLLDWNGTLLMAFNMNTSGNNITVNINSTAGSFYIRLGFFEEYPDAEDFRSAVAAMTYGDDFLGSVLAQFRNFNFQSYKKFLAKHKMKITPPDKGETELTFLDKEDADFLKRQSHYIPEIGVEIGRLDEMSIFKSLHSNLRSRVATPIEVALGCIDTAMHEWFAHGRDVYELRAKQMEEVCRRADIPASSVRVTYDERVAHWKEKYSS